MHLTTAQLNAIALTDTAISELGACLLNARQLGVTIVITGGEDVAPWVKSRSVQVEITPEVFAESLHANAEANRQERQEMRIGDTTYFAEATNLPIETVSVGTVTATPDVEYDYGKKPKRMS